MLHAETYGLCYEMWVSAVINIEHCGRDPPFPAGSSAGSSIVDWEVRRAEINSTSFCENIAFGRNAGVQRRIHHYRDRVDEA